MYVKTIRPGSLCDHSCNWQPVVDRKRNYNTIIQSFELFSYRPQFVLPPILQHRQRYWCRERNVKLNEVSFSDEYLFYLDMYNYIEQVELWFVMSLRMATFLNFSIFMELHLQFYLSTLQNLLFQQNIARPHIVGSNILM